MDQSRSDSNPEMTTDRLLDESGGAAGLDRTEQPPVRAARLEPDDATVALDEWADQLRQAHLRHALDELEGLDAAQRAAIADCSRAIVDAILQCPRWRLRSDDEVGSAAVVTLFELEGTTPLDTDSNLK